MPKLRWHILQDGNSLTLARHLPVRFDLSADTRLPLADPLRIAHQMRQDMWRMLQDLRGFSPVVRFGIDDAGLQVTAGGRVAGRVPPGATDLIADLLQDTRNRARWIRFAKVRQGQLPFGSLRADVTFDKHKVMVP